MAAGSSQLASIPGVDWYIVSRTKVVRLCEPFWRCFPLLIRPTTLRGLICGRLFKLLEAYSLAGPGIIIHSDSSIA